MNREVITAEVNNPETNAFDRYLNQIGRIALLDAAGEVELAKDIEAGLYAQEILIQEEFTSAEEFHDLEALRQRGAEARKELVAANLRLVIPIANSYRGKGVPLMDLIQEGSLGLIDAAIKFNYSKGFKFSTLATFKIRERIIRSFYTQGYNDPVGRALAEKLSKLSNTRQHLQESLGRTPTKQELAAEMKLPEAQLDELLYMGNDKISLDSQVGDGDVTLSTYLQDGDDNGDPVNTLMMWSMQDDVNDLLARLDHSRQAIIRGRFGFDDDKIVSHTALAKALNMKYADVKRLEAEILDELRSDEKADTLREYLY